MVAVFVLLLAIVVAVTVYWWQQSNRTTAPDERADDRADDTLEIPDRGLDRLLFDQHLKSPNSHLRGMMTELMERYQLTPGELFDITKYVRKTDVRVEVDLCQWKHQK